MTELDDMTSASGSRLSLDANRWGFPSISYYSGAPDNVLKCVSWGGFFPVPDLQINNSDGPVFVLEGDALVLTVGMESGGFDEDDADWWTYADSPYGTFWYAMDAGWVRTPTPIPAYQGSLFNLAQHTVGVYTLPLGIYLIHFAVHDNMDGVFDGTWEDQVQVEVY